MPATKTATKTATKKTTTRRKAAPKAVEAPVVEEKPVEAPVVEEKPEEPVNDRKNRKTEDAGVLADSMEDISNNLSKMSKVLAALAKEQKRLAAAFKRYAKRSQKGGRRQRAPRDPNRPPKEPSGFAKPGPISSELADFLDVSRDTELARTEVTKRITKYIQDNKLQTEKDRRVIVPDDRLSKLLNMPADSPNLTFFNLQRYMKQHYPKKQE